MKPKAWKLGQFWKDRHGYVWRVVEVRGDVAFLEMLRPYRTRPCSQKPIPSDWTCIRRPVWFDKP